MSMGQDYNKQQGILDLIVGGDKDRGGLAPFFSLGTPDDLISSIIDLQENKDLLGTDLHVAVKRAAIDVIRGAFTTRDLIKNLDDQLQGTTISDEDVVKAITIIGPADIPTRYFNGVSLDDTLKLTPDNFNSAQPSKQTPGIAAILINPIGLSPGLKNESVLTLFMNAIPTIEFSRAMPYVNITLQTNRPPTTADGTLNGVTLLKFLLGADKVQDGTANRSMADAAAIPVSADTNSDEVATQAGMELFLAPQTLAPITIHGLTETNSPSLRAAPILDPFRPLVSIESLGVSVVGSTGYMSNKTAQLSLIVHDRSRLAEVADFVKPDLYQQTEFLIEYGWNSPVQNADYLNNPWAALLNAIRLREKYQIVNSSFNFGEDGAVKIMLELSMKGGIEYESALIGSSPEIKSTSNEIQQLQETITSLTTSITSKTPSGVKSRSVLSGQALEAASAGVGGLDISPELRKSIKSIISKFSNGTANQKKLSEELEKLYGDKGDGGVNSKFNKLKTQINAVITDKFKMIKKDRTTQETPDPFLKNVDDKKRAKWVSFGKLFMLFVAQPMASTGKYDDVQVLFYSFNSSAGKIRNKNISSFEIDIEELEKGYSQFIQQRRGAAMSAAEFNSWIMSTFMDSLASENYGMSDVYKTAKGKDKNPSDVVFAGGLDEAKAATRLEKLLKQWKISEFKMPQVNLHLETVPARQPAGQEGKNSEEYDAKTILRIHIYDASATAYETQMQLLNAQRDDQLGSISFDESDPEDDDALARNRASKLVDMAIATKLIEPITLNVTNGPGPGGQPLYKQYQYIGGHNALKEFVRSTAPNIICSAQNSAVESLSVQSMQDPNLSTVNMLRTDRAGSLNPNSTGRGGIPLKTIPAEVNIVSLGCPVLSFGQQLFIDMQTGTDLDNLYAITSIQHTLDTGGFKSSFQLVPLGGYGKYESTISKIESAIAQLDKLSGE